MLSLAYSWLLLIFFLPWLIKPWLADYREARQALRVPFMDRLSDASGQVPGKGSAVMTGHRGQKFLRLLIWALLIVALARPQWWEEPIVEERSLRDMLLLVDLSGSMQTRDFTDLQGNQIDRLEAVKQVLNGFLQQRQGDRIGLIFFGSAAFVQAPFSEDLNTVQSLLDEAQVGMAGPKTVIGDALGLALNLFEDRKIEQRVVILLTDGNDTGSVIPPDQAAQIAHDQGVIVHVVGVGSSAVEGEQPLDEKTLQAIASASGGAYFKAENQQALKTVYETLDQLTPVKVEGRSYRPRHELYHWPLGLAMGLLLVFHLLLAMKTLSGKVAEQ